MRYFLALYRGFFGILTLAAVAVQCAQGLQQDNFQLSNFFSFFTIESNILAAIILMISAYGAWAQKRNATFALIRGAAVLYMVTTGIVYALLLSGLEVSLQTTIPWVNTVLHYLMPIVLLVDWLIDPPARRILFKQAAVWLVFPILYLIYSLIRGAITGWYPYPFLNPHNGGYGKVTVVSVVIAAAVMGLTWLIARMTRLRRTA